MPSTKQLAFDQTKFDRYIQGDLGIADLIYNQEVKPIISQAKTPQDIALLQPLIVPNKKTGLWALERTFIQTTFELHRPLIELNKHLLELFGHLEYIVACISGGANPFNLPSSYANAFKQNIADMSKFTTKFEPDNLNSAGQSQSPPPVLPLIIFLGRFDAIGQKLSSNNEEIDKFKLDTNNYIWPQYQNKDEFTTEQTDLINQETESVDEPYKSEIRNSRSDSFDDEWDDMDSKNQLKTNFNYLPPNLKKYYRPMTVDYQNQQVEIDLEEDYNIEVHLFYSMEFYDFFGAVEVWDEINKYLIKWRESIPNFPNFNFDSDSQDTFKEIKDLSPSLYNHLFSDDEIYEQIIKTLFPTGETLRLLLKYFSSKNATIYKTISKKLAERITT